MLDKNVDASRRLEALFVLSIALKLRSGKTLAAADTALGILAAVVKRDGQQYSVTYSRDQALADANHLAILDPAAS